VTAATRLALDPGTRARARRACAEQRLSELRVLREQITGRVAASPDHAVRAAHAAMQALSRAGVARASASVASAAASRRSAQLGRAGRGSVR
jgi:hypothetical protein